MSKERPFIMDHRNWSVKMLLVVSMLLNLHRVCFSDATSGQQASQPLTANHGERASKGQNLHSLPVIENGTFFVPDIQSYSNTQLYALLVDVLEKLNVLVPKAPSCYQLQKIMHEVLPQAGSGSSGGDSGSHNLLGVYLYFKETPLSSELKAGSAGSQSASSEGGSSSSHNNNKSTGNGPSGGGGLGVSPSPPVKASNECVSEPHFVQTLDAQPLVRSSPQSSSSNSSYDRRGAGAASASSLPGAGTSQDGGEKSNRTRKADAGPQTGPNGEFQRNDGDGSGGDSGDNSANNDDDGFGGLSRTQVVVISTCSAIIGCFFIVAFVLRVRNYIKRVRHEQEQARRPTFRSCSVRLRSVGNSNEQVRRDSQVSKLSHQSNLTGSRGGGGGGQGGGGGSGTGGGYSLTNGSCNGSRDHSNASSPHHDPDTKPLLLVTASVMEGGLHHPQRLSSPPSLPCTPSGSQTSSLQYIDEDSRSRKVERAVLRALIADDSEVRPLLASSEVSANSLHLSPLSPNSPTSLPSTTLSSQDFPTQQGQVSYKNPTLADVPASFCSAGNSSENPHTLVGVVGPCNSPDSGDTASACTTALKAASFEADDATFHRMPSGGSLPQELVSRDGVCQESSVSGVQLPPPLLGCCGLTQSDASLNSGDGDRNYGYGTQSEYVPPVLPQGPYPFCYYYPSVSLTAELMNGMVSPLHNTLPPRYLSRKPALFRAYSYVPNANVSFDIPGGYPPGLDTVYAGARSRTRSVEFTKQDSVMSDYGWYDFGTICSPPPSKGNTTEESVFNDAQSAVPTSPDSGLELQQPLLAASPPLLSSAILSAADSPHYFEDGGESCGVTTSASTSTAEAGEQECEPGGGGHGNLEWCDSDCVSTSPVGSGTTDRSSKDIRNTSELSAVAADTPLSFSSSESPAQQTSIDEPSSASELAQTQDQCVQSDAPTESPEHLSNQSYASTQSSVGGDSELMDNRLSSGGTMSCSPNHDASDNTPETTVVMKRLLSSEDERTTFL